MIPTPVPCLVEGVTFINIVATCMKGKKGNSPSINHSMATPQTSLDTAAVRRNLSFDTKSIAVPRERARVSWQQPREHFEHQHQQPRYQPEADSSKQSDPRANPDLLLHQLEDEWQQRMAAPLVALAEFEESLTKTIENAQASLPPWRYAHTVD